MHNYFGQSGRPALHLDGRLPEVRLPDQPSLPDFVVLLFVGGTQRHHPPAVLEIEIRGRLLPPLGRTAAVYPASGTSSNVLCASMSETTGGRENGR